jgi:hypothetical protein
LIFVLKDLLRTAGDQFIKNLLENPDKIDPKVLLEMLKHLDSLPPEMRDKILKELMKKLGDLPEELRNQVIRALLKNSDALDLSDEQLKVSFDVRI